MTQRKNKDYAIGVFDSGLGGLTVVKALMQHLPHEDIVYFGDTARVPYGTKSRESIIRFSKENVRVLMKRKVKAVVVACNSSSSYALPVLRREYPIPVIGVIEPGVRKAVSITKNRIIGVIATPATINSSAYLKNIKKKNASLRVISQACPLFVPLVEEGWFHKDVTVTVAQEYLNTIKGSGVDTLILGCTHYPLLKMVLREVMGPGVKLVDSAQEVAQEVKRVVQRKGLLREDIRKPCYEFLVSDSPQHFRNLAKRFLGYDIRKVSRV